MLGSDSLVLPVYRDDEFYGVATADDLLDAVEPYLHVLSVDDVWTPEIVTVDPASTLGNVLHQFREHRITHLPVVDGNRAIGVVSLSDVIGFAAREAHRSQGGNPPEAVQGGRSHGGFGAREGELHRLLDLPVRDVMSEPVVTVRPDTRLDDAVRTMFDREVSSLVVTVDDAPAGIATKNDVLESLTWTGETRLQVKFVGIELLDDISRDEVVDMIERIAQRYGEMRILEASVYLHEHDEKLRGTPLVLARIRLFTDRGQFVGTGEGYGASHALHLARNVLERDVLEGKQYGQTKKHPTEEELSKFYGWWLTGSARPR
nr:CBS domain-containing protein [Halobium salinum]